MLGRSETFRGKTGTHFYLELEFDGDIERLNQSFNKLIMNQPMLRASVCDLQSFQINPPFQYEIPVEHATDWCKEEKSRFIDIRRSELSHKLYSSTSFPFFTIECMEVDVNKYYLFFSLDLLIADGMSVFQLFDQWRCLYEDPDYSIGDMSDHLIFINQSYHEEKASDRYNKSRAFWLKELEVLPEAPEFHLNTEMLRESDFQRLEYSFSENEFLRMNGISKQLDLSLNTVCLALYASVLQRWSANKEFTLNMTTFKRPRKEQYLSVIGDFTSTSLIKTQINAKDTLQTNVQRLQRTINESFRYSAFEGIEVLRELSKQSHRSGEMPYVFTSMLFDFPHFDSFFKLHYWISETPQVYLDCQLKLINGELNVSWDFVSRIFEPSLITAMFNSYIDSLHTFLTKEDQVLEYMDQQQVEKKEQRFRQYNSEATKSLKDTRILHAFSETLKRWPRRAAFSDLEQTITFQELDQKSEIIACQIKNLKAAQGLSKARIAIFTSKRVAAMAEMLAVIKSGDSFCFVNPELPEERINYITDSIHNEIQIRDGEVIFVAQATSSKVAEDELYVIFTSGTTGRPKGISINEKAVLNTIYDLHERLTIEEEDVLFNISELSFDLSIFDVISPLLAGCKTILCKGIHEFKEHKPYLTEVTLWNSTPGLVQMLIQALDSRAYRMRCVLMSGDFVPVQIVKDIRDALNREDLQIYSLGGATEASIWSIYYPLMAQFDRPKIPYGYPLSNQSMYVLDKHNHLVNEFVYGEICIGGEGLANGYLDQEMTEEAFFVHPSLGRLYRTGDKGYMSGEGCIEITGRIQFELKINGYRIDLIEISNAINQLDEVHQSKVFVKKNKKKSSLVAVYTARNNEDSPVHTMRDRLSRLLPDYMIPTTFIKVDTIPLNVNGKVDTKQLEGWFGNIQEIPLHSAEQQLLELWRRIIGPEAEELNHVYENFFDAGGDSIKLPELLHEIQNTYQVKLTVEDMLNHFSLSEMAKMLSERRETIGLPERLFHSQLVQLTKGRTDKNMVLIHAGSGEVAIYNQLSLKINPDYNVYSIKFAKNYEDVAPRTIRLDELAEQYADVVQSLDSVDYLGGWCIGGAIGFEMAKRNRDIQQLILINSMPPVTEPAGTPSFSIEDEKLFVEQSFGLTFSDAVRDTTTLWNEVISLLEQHTDLMPRLISIVPPELARLIPFFGSNKPRELIYYINLFRSFENARYRYENEEKISTPMLYVGAIDEEVAGYQNWSDQTSGAWLEEHVKGDHTTIFDRDHVEELAASINRMLVSDPVSTLN